MTYSTQATGTSQAVTKLNTMVEAVIGDMQDFLSVKAKNIWSFDIPAD